MPPRGRSSRRHPLGAKNNTRHTTTCSRKFEMKNTTPTISESSINLRADGWFHIENEGVHPNRKARVVPVLDDEACRRSVNRFNTEADRPGFPGTLIDHEGRGGQSSEVGISSGRKPIADFAPAFLSAVPDTVWLHKPATSCRGRNTPRARCGLLHVPS